jgi:hypothetical protein
MMAAGQGFKTFTTGEVLTAGDVNGYLMQGINVFADAAARTAAITSPQEGQYSYLKDSNSLWYYSGSAWVAAGGSPLTTKGDLYGYSTTDARIPVGANDTVLTADSTAALGVKWATASAGGMTLISTVTASAATSVSFTSIPGTYTNLLLTWEKVFSSVADTACWGIRFNNDTTANYHFSWGVGAEGASSPYGGGNAGTLFGNNDARRSPILGAKNAAGTDGDNCYGAMNIYNYADATNGTNANYITSARQTSSNQMFTQNCVYEGTSAISQIDFIRNSTQTVTGTFRLYGVS